MAEFEKAYARLRGFEGGYVDDPADRGGETYSGISRRWWPSWGGWSVIDAAKQHHSFAAGRREFSAHLRSLPSLHDMVVSWYREQWWESLGLSAYRQEMANEMFEQAVNMGPEDMCRRVQRCCNALNWESDGTISGRKIFDDLKVDGWFGPKTSAAVKMVSDAQTAALFVRMLNALQAEYYISLAHNVFSQRKFLRGWLKRTENLAGV